VPLASWSRRYKWDLSAAEHVLWQSDCPLRGGIRGKGKRVCFWFLVFLVEGDEVFLSLMHVQMNVQSTQEQEGTPTVE
jgi:hypothetical protein